MAEFLSHPVPAVVILLGVLVFVHELGHYLVGRLCGIAVEVFSIGFGPKIIAFNRKGTEYRLSWIPLGGYVKFAGAHPSEDVPEGLQGRGFLQTSLPKRALTVMAGPAANFLLAVAVYMALAMKGISHPPPIIGEVMTGSPAEVAGLEYGDVLISIEGTPVKTWRDLEELISEAPERQLSITVERNGRQVEVELTPAKVETEDFAGRPVTKGRAGIALGRTPAILTVTDAQGAAAKAGIKTGDRVKSIRFGDNYRPVTYLPELLNQLERALEQGAHSVDLTVQEAPVPGASEGEDKLQQGLLTGDARRLTLDLTAARSAYSKEGEVGHQQLAYSLGFAGSQLTVAEAQAPLDDVLQQGDMILRWREEPVQDLFKLRELLIANEDPSVEIEVLRAGEPLTLKAPLKGVEMQRPEGKVTVYTLPVLFWGQPEAPEPIIEVYANPLRALAYGVRETAVQTGTLFVNVASLFTGEIPLQALGGPMLIAKVAGDSAARGVETFLGSMALISINLGLLNLFPIPVLDGGQLVLMGAEAVRRRPLRESAIENFQKIGFAMVLALVVLATYNDLSRFWTSMLESLVGIFP